MRLLDPQLLSRRLGARFVNLAMNAATPWEQLQLAGLFRSHVAVPRRIIWGLDTTWCEPDATDPGRRLTPRRYCFFRLPAVFLDLVFGAAGRRPGSRTSRLRLSWCSSMRR